MEDKIGRLRVGNRADVCLWDREGELKGVWIGGKRLVGWSQIFVSSIEKCNLVVWTWVERGRSNKIDFRETCALRILTLPNQHFFQDAVKVSSTVPTLLAGSSGSILNLPLKFILTLNSRFRPSLCPRIDTTEWQGSWRWKCTNESREWIWIRQ